MFEWNVVQESGYPGANKVKQIIERMDASGWELVEAYSDNGVATFIFKRPKSK